MVFSAPCAECIVGAINGQIAAHIAGQPATAKDLVPALQRRFPGSELVCEVTNRAWIDGLRGKMAESKKQRQLNIGEGARYRFGLDAPDEMESWHAGIEFLEFWSYFDSNHPKLGWMRMQFLVEHPRLYQLFFNALLNSPRELREEMAPRYAEYAAVSRQRLRQGLDRSKFREDVDVEEAIELVELVLEGITSRYAPRLKQVSAAEALELVERITEETRRASALLKKGVYRVQSE